MNIQWYPGHMTKAKRAMETDVKAVDLIIEIVDARAPLATRNPDINRIGAGKERIIVMNKSDLAEEAVSAAWARKFRQDGAECFLMDARSRKDLKQLLQLIEKACAKKKERDRQRGILNRPVRAMVAGIPNVGKSTLINTIAGKTTAKTGNRPGVTKGNQWIRMNKTVELLDTPGILWPKFEDPQVGAVIAWLGSINEMLVQPVELSGEFIQFLRQNGKDAGLNERFGVTPEMRLEEAFRTIAMKRGCLIAGGGPDYDKAAGLVMNEFRTGQLGRISLEEPEREHTDAAGQERNADENTEG